MCSLKSKNLLTLQVLGILLGMAVKISTLYLVELIENPAFAFYFCVYGEYVL